LGENVTSDRSKNRTRILLCDDTKDIRALLGAELGLHPDLELVGEACTGAQAIDLAGRIQPDVVVLDLAMPEMDGIAALPEIRRVAPAARVIVLSALESSSVERKVLDLGAERYVEKGTAAGDIVDAVREARDSASR
jgi:DNA-binding NarL/FixJ family response regulator